MGAARRLSPRAVLAHLPLAFALRRLSRVTLCSARRLAWHTRMLMIMPMLLLLILMLALVLVLVLTMAIIKWATATLWHPQ